MRVDFLLGPEDADISITSFAESAGDEGGYSQFVLLDTPRGKGAGRGVEVADAARFAEAAREVSRREQASATRRRATGRAQWSATGMDHAQLLPKFDAVYAWTPRVRVIVKRMTAYLARERQHVFVELEELEKHIGYYRRFRLECV